MNLQRLALIVLFLFVAGLVSTAAGEALHSSTSGDQVSHSEGSSCPDPDDDGNPCGPTCPYACCPGHVACAAFAVQSFCLGVPPSNEIKLQHDDALNPKDVHFRIFHPPRA
jgi:hypothetical protein